MFQTLFGALHLVTLPMGWTNLVPIFHNDITFILQSNAKPLIPIDYKSDNPVILVVNTSYIAVSFYLCQCTSDNWKQHCYNWLGSIMLNDQEAHFSQPKLELYSLYRALQALCMYLLGIRNLIIEVDTHYIKGMLQNPNIQPSASTNCWIIGILMFYFKLVHIKGTFHRPNGLLQQ